MKYFILFCLALPACGKAPDASAPINTNIVGSYKSLSGDYWELLTFTADTMLAQSNVPNLGGCKDYDLYHFSINGANISITYINNVCNVNNCYGKTCVPLGKIGGRDLILPFSFTPDGISITLKDYPRTTSANILRPYGK